MAAIIAATNPSKGDSSKTLPSSPSSSQSSRRGEARARRHLSRLQALCRSVPLRTPDDPVRSKAWDAWANRERGAVIFRGNRAVLSAGLAARGLGLKIDVGTSGTGSALRRMMSVRDIRPEIDDIIQCAVEAEAARSQKLQVSFVTEIIISYYLYFLY